MTLSRSDSVTLKLSSMLLVEGVRSSLIKSELEGISSEWRINWVDINTQRTRSQIFMFIVKTPMLSWICYYSGTSRLLDALVVPRHIAT